MRRIMEGGVVFLGVAMMFVGIGCCCPRAVEPTFLETPVTPPSQPVKPIAVIPPAPQPVEIIPPAPSPVDTTIIAHPTPNFYIVKDVAFDSGSTVVKPDARAALMKLAQELNGPDAKAHPFTITGHTDTDRVVKPPTIANLKALGKPADNMGLSDARAESVAAVLKAGGVDASRMTTFGKGETEPRADNRTPAGKAQNRRVEILLKTAEGATPGALRSVDY
jgi:outer membrane protein OmpA-like peptidoglycan-associated protein